MSNRTSTAALGWFCSGSLANQRRVPGHPRPRLSTCRMNCISEEAVMNATTPLAHPTFRKAFPMMLRIVCSLLLWSIGASAMDLRITPFAAKEHRVVVTFPVDRAKAEELQRWVNAGHDPWCRDSQLVAISALRRVSGESEGYESASLSAELEQNQRTKAVYTFHSLDGRTTYRITLRRHLYLLPAAGSLHRIIWIPETAEIITRAAQD